METTNLKKAGILALLLTLIAIVGWELYLRNLNYPVSYNDDSSLWALKRKQVYKPINEATVFIGSSRMKFDLDIPTWENITGEKAIQLAFVGTSPRPVLTDLADDRNFKGKVIIDVTEGIMFDRNVQRSNESATKAIADYKNWTPTQKVSTSINMLLESKLIFLDNKFNLKALLNDLKVPPRKNVWMFPHFPRGFEMCTYDRQNFMTEEFVRDTAQHNKQIAAWIHFGDTIKFKAIDGDSLQQIFKKIKTDIDKIIARGGKVLFVRTPSTGGYWSTEKVVFAREKYWDALLAYTKTPGIHFKDYPETADLHCPEWSHLTPKDAIAYTRSFIKMVEEKGWSFQNKQIVSNITNSKKSSHGF